MLFRYRLCKVAKFSYDTPNNQNLTDNIDAKSIHFLTVIKDKSSIFQYS
ncbi:hypothetical protein HMPREF1573_00068 [Gardnerella vaginalis JCP7276]|nr:hypothetical protein HMPREF1575_01132 [Gardnerella vaginalis JCP7672]EPI57637.1 hypothetical protein HMPREF1573_00068 [Gardnerella vaginalis JCP7276]